MTISATPLYATSSSAYNGAAGVNVLFGVDLRAQHRRRPLAALIGAVLVAVVPAVARPVRFATIDTDVAAARGRPVRAKGIAFLTVVGVGLTISYLPPASRPERADGRLWRRRCSRLGLARRRRYRERRHRHCMTGPPNRLSGPTAAQGRTQQ